MCIFFFWDILVGILVLPHSARDGCMARWLARLAVWLDCCLAGLLSGWPGGLLHGWLTLGLLAGLLASLGRLGKTLIGRLWESLERLGKAQEGLWRRLGKAWEGLGRLGKAWEGLGRLGKAWE